MCLGWYGIINERKKQVYCQEARKASGLWIKHPGSQYKRLSLRRENIMDMNITKRSMILWVRSAVMNIDVVHNYQSNR